MKKRKVKEEEREGKKRKLVMPSDDVNESTTSMGVRA